MNSLKFALPVGLLVVVVFGATIISMNVGNQGTTGGSSGEFVPSGPPLYFTHEAIGYDPTSEDMVLRTFQGFYEPGGPKVLIPFWFKNPHPVPVVIAAIGRSCTSCSTVRVATFSNADVDTFAQRTTVGCLLASPIGPPSLLTALSALALVGSATNQDFNFDRPDDTITVPAATNATTPTWGMLILGVDVTGIGPKQLRADFSFTAGKTPTVNKSFVVTVAGVAPFEVVPKQVKFDDLPEGAEPQSKELFYWSSTRGMPAPGREAWPTLSPPNVSLSGTDPFFKIGAPIPFSEEQLARAPVQQGQGGAPVRVLSGYRIPITILRSVPGTQPGTTLEPDIGPYERTIGITSPGTVASQSVKVQANMTGLVSLRGTALSVDLGSFRESGTRVKASLITDRKDITLEPLPDETKPSYLNVTLLPKNVEGGRTYWPFEIEIKPGVLSGELPLDSVIVFKITTPTGLRKVRVPVKGRAYR